MNWSETKGSGANAGAGTRMVVVKEVPEPVVGLN